MKYDLFLGLLGGVGRNLEEREEGEETREGQVMGSLSIEEEEGMWTVKVGKKEVCLIGGKWVAR